MMNRELFRRDLIMKIKKLQSWCGICYWSDITFFLEHRRVSKIKVNYAINMVANGSPYGVQTQALKPFTTDDGYTYLSVRS